MRGRKPKPTAIKLVTGNPGHRPPPPDEPSFSATMPKCPPHLDAEAKREWRRTGPKLDAAMLMTDVYRAMFALYCQAWSDWVRATKALRKEGPVIMAKVRITEYTDGKVVRTGGVPIVNPYQKIANEAWMRVKQSGSELGITPVSSSRVKVAERKQLETDRRDRFFR